jgi:hypothetical protein
MLPIHSVSTIESLECVNSFTKGELRLFRIPTPIMAVRTFARKPAEPRRTRIAEGADTILRGVGGVCFVLLWPLLWPVLMITAGLKMFHFGTRLLHSNGAMGALFWLVSVGCAAGVFFLSNKKSKRSQEYFSGSRLHLDFLLMNSLWLIVITATLFEVQHLLKARPIATLRNDEST